MPQHNKVATPKKAKNQESRPEEKFFNQYIWHHKVHENLDEKLRYFLLQVRPYNEIKLRNSLKQLVKDKHISGLRAYRVFGRNDLMIRAWMDDATFGKMVLFFYEYIQIGAVTLGVPQPDYVQKVEYRWYWEETPPTSPALARNAALMIQLKLNQGLVPRVESGKPEDGAFFRKYESEGLVVPKPSTEDTITFFICIRISENSINPEDRQRLVDSIREEILGGDPYLYPEIDSTSGVICNLILRARVRAADYFKIGSLTRWLTTQHHVAGTETYLSLTERPLFGSTNLSLATLYALEPIHPICEYIFTNLQYPHGPYPTALWGKIGTEVVNYLKDKGAFTPPEGLRTFLQNFLLGVLKEDKDAMGSAFIPVHPVLEGHLRENHTEYIKKLDLRHDEVYKAAGVEKKNKDTLMLMELFNIYFKAVGMCEKPRPLKNPGGWDAFADARNKPFHGADYTWKTAADIVIQYWDEIQLLLEDIESVCESTKKHRPKVFAK